MDAKTLEELVAETWPEAERMEPVEPKAMTPGEAEAVMEEGEHGDA